MESSTKVLRSGYGCVWGILENQLWLKLEEIGAFHNLCVCISVKNWMAGVNSNQDLRKAYMGTETSHCKSNGEEMASVF